MRINQTGSSCLSTWTDGTSQAKSLPTGCSFPISGPLKGSLYLQLATEQIARGPENRADRPLQLQRRYGNCRSDSERVAATALPSTGMSQTPCDTRTALETKLFGGSS